MPSESSPLLSFNTKKGDCLTTSHHGIIRELWAVYLIYLLAAVLDTITIGSELHIKTEMICNSISWDSVNLSSKQDCLSDTVDSRLTWLMTIESITLGCFSALSTGYWSYLSQKRGRSIVLLVVFLGLGLNELIFILAKRFEWPVNVLLIGSMVEGILGGPATLTTIITGYIHDRLSQRHLSTATGLLLATGTAMIGAAIGPSFANWLIAFSDANLMAPSYAILVCLPALAIMTRFLVPDEQVAASKTFLNDSQTGTRNILAPLQVLRPSIHGDHNLLFLGICYGLYCFIAGSSTVKLQYASSRFAWDAVEIGEYMTIVGVSKVASLLFIVPGMMYFWNRNTNNYQVVDLPVDDSVMEGENLADEFHYATMDQDFSNLTSQTNTKPATVVLGCPSTNTSQSSLTLCQSEGDIAEDGVRWKPSTLNRGLELTECLSSILPQSYQTKIDLKLARFSIGWGMICCVGLVFSQSMLSFIIPSALESLSRSTGPAIQAVALSLISVKNEHIGSTDVISSFSLIGILMYDLLGPLFFGTVYVNSRSQEFGKSFLFVVVALEMINLTLISFVKLSGHKTVDEETCCSEDGEEHLDHGY